MKSSLTFTAAALLLMSHAAGAQDQQTPMMSDQQPQGMQGMMGQGMMGQGRMGPHTGMRIMLILMDTDGDGALSLEEVQAAHARIFKQVDSDHDGKVTLKEIETFFGDSPSTGAH